MAQRLRLTFASTGPLRYVGHLDMMRTWERTVRRAALPLVYSQGFSPHARLALAAPLPVGVAGLRELIDIWLDPPVAPAEARERINAAAPPGLEIVAAEEVGERLPSLQSSLVAARYEVALAPGTDADALEARVRALLALETLPWEEERGDRVRRSDLRATIHELALERRDGGPAVLAMALSLLEGRTGRPAQVLRALGLDAADHEITRLEITTDQPLVAIQAWREHGRFAD